MPARPGHQPAHGPTDQTVPVGAACFALQTRMAARALTRRYDRALRPLGLGSPQFGILSAVALSLDMSETALADRLGLERTTLVRNLKLLERKGWVEPVGGAGRGLRHRLTEDGRAALEAARPVWAAVQAEVEAALGPETQAVRGSLRALRRAAT